MCWSKFKVSLHFSKLLANLHPNIRFSISKFITVMFLHILSNLQKRQRCELFTPKLAAATPAPPIRIERKPSIWSVCFLQGGTKGVEIVTFCWSFCILMLHLYSSALSIFGIWFSEGFVGVNWDISHTSPASAKWKYNKERQAKRLHFSRHPVLSPIIFGAIFCFYRSFETPWSENPRNSRKFQPLIDAVNASLKSMKIYCNLGFLLFSSIYLFDCVPRMFRGPPNFPIRKSASKIIQSIQSVPWTNWKLTGRNANTLGTGN